MTPHPDVSTAVRYRVQFWLRPPCGVEIPTAPEYVATLAEAESRVASVTAADGESSFALIGHRVTEERVVSWSGCGTEPWR